MHNLLRQPLVSISILLLCGCLHSSITYATVALKRTCAESVRRLSHCAEVLNSDVLNQHGQADVVGVLSAGQLHEPPGSTIRAALHAAGLGYHWQLG